MNKLLMLLKIGPSLLTMAERLKLLFKGELKPRKAIFLLIGAILAGASVGTGFLSIDDLNGISEVLDEALDLVE